MKFIKYFKDRLYAVCIFLSALIINVLIMCAFKVQIQLIIAEVFIMSTFYVAVFLIDYFRKKGFYNELVNNAEALDEKYFIIETMQKPGFYEGQILYDIVGDIEHSMTENVKRHRLGMESFKEYVEMWIHEIKLPIASLTLMLHNHRGGAGKAQAGCADSENGVLQERMNMQIRRINDYIEQILYYVRSENAEKDYIINDVRLSKIIGAAAMRNKDDLLENNISFIVNNADTIVLTDSKWMEFMLNQIISNSIKYRDEKKQEAYIKLNVLDNKNVTVLEIEDNGIGINESDIPRVFDKSFTGENGREYSKATGMGLYIVKKLCDKMGHGISIRSVKGESTKVSISFYKNDFYKNII